MPTPLLILSDSPSCSSGLGRITRDIATRIATDMPEVFKVATLGYGGPGDASLPFMQYHIHSIQDWIVPELPLVWANHVGDEMGILLVIWDPSRVMWLADPARCPIPSLAKFLATTPMKKWIYAPVDAEGPNGKLSVLLDRALKGFDRVLNYTKWSAGVTGYPDHLPHGIDTNVFYPRDKKESKRKFREQGFVGLKDDSFLVGIVATNQARKDWALGIQTIRLLLDRGLDVRLWAHTDDIRRYWDMSALVHDYELQGRVVITTSNFTDDQMAIMYSACDVTLGIGMGEGFGFPVFESLASGTPCIIGDYGGAAEHFPPGYKITPIAYRYEGPYTCKRPVFDISEWADACCRVESMGDEVQLPSDLDWNNAWPEWKKWLLKGVGK